MSAAPLEVLPDAERGSFDGGERAIHALFERPESELRPEIEAILATAPDWLTQYHLSPQRRLLLSWYGFPRDATVLEIGAGCGALTGLLCDRAAHVVANEKFLVRAEALARRLADRANLRVVAGGIEHVALDEPADVVVCVGVWEYAGVFLEADDERRFTDPFRRFLDIVRALVRPGGRLLLAIENKLGLQYLAGAEEDHGGHGILASVESYPDFAGVRTFSRAEIVRLLAEAGFGASTFHLPFPDYKLPRVVVREDALHDLGVTPAALRGLVAWHRPRLPLVNEHMLALALHDADVLAAFANSFLVEARG